MSPPIFSFSVRKALCVHLGEKAGKELADVLQRLSERVEHLERSKVDVTPIIPISDDGFSAPPARRAA